MYLRSNSELYVHDLETQYLTTTHLSHISGSSSNLQTQINNKPNRSDGNRSLNTKLNLLDAYTSATVNSL